MEGCGQVEAGVEPGAPQRVEPSAPPALTNPHHMVTTLNSDRVPTVRAAPPPVAPKVKDSPEVHHLQMPSPIRRPTEDQSSQQLYQQPQQASGINYFQGYVNQVPGHHYPSGNPSKIQGILSQAQESMSSMPPVQRNGVGPD